MTGVEVGCLAMAIGFGVLGGLIIVIMWVSRELTKLKRDIHGNYQKFRAAQTAFDIVSKDQTNQRDIIVNLVEELGYELLYRCSGFEIKKIIRNRK